MDPNGSNGSSPLTDGDLQKNDGNIRQSSATDDEDGSKKGQQGGNSRSGIPSQNQQAGGVRKGPIAGPTGTSTVWRPIPSVGQVANQMARMPGKPRMPVGSPNQGIAVSGTPQTGAWPNTGANYFPTPRGPSRFPVNNQNIPQQSLGHFIGQPPSNMISNNGVQTGYGGPRNMVAQTGMSAAGSQEQLSKTNLYIRGLPPNTNDRHLFEMCMGYGTINSTKAIIDKMSNQCKGYGFVDFDNPQSADRALKDLTQRGMQVQMAKVRSPQDQMQVSQDADPTNLYLANLPPFMVEQDLDVMLQQYGRVVSTRVLRDVAHQSRGVGFARMESKEVCDKVIELLNGKILGGSTEPLVVKFADSGNRRRQMNRDRGAWQRMDGQRMGMGGYGQLDAGQNGMPGSMMTSIRYSVPQAAALAGYQASWQPQYTILPQQMTQMMQGVEGGYSMSQLAAQMSQLGLSSPYNPSPFSQYGYKPQMFPQGMAQLGAGAGGQQGDEQQQDAGVPGHSSVGVNPSQNMAGAYASYSQQK